MQLRATILNHTDISVLTKKFPKYIGEKSRLNRVYRVRYHFYVKKFERIFRKTLKDYRWVVR